MPHTNPESPESTRLGAPLFSRMEQLGRKALATAGVILALGAVGNDAAAQAATEPLQVGIATYNWDTENGHQTFKTMSSIGMNVVRLTVAREYWQRDLGTLEQELPSIEANDIEPVVVLQQASGIPKPGYAKWASNMALELPEVHRFVIENEVNSKAFWQGTMQQYAQQLYRTYNSMHAARSDITVSGVALDSIEDNDPEGWLRHFMGYATKKYGGPQALMDSLSVHLYRSTQQDEAMVIEDESLWDGPINIDEFGRIVKNPRAGYAPPGSVTPQRQAKDYTDFITWAANDPRIRSIENYHLYNPSTPDDLHTGIITPAGVPMPALFAVKSTLSEIFTPLATASASNVNFVH